jgi:hypothetical protein
LTSFYFVPIIILSLYLISFFGENMSDENQITNLEDLRAVVDSHDGVLTTTMEVLREAYGSGRLGIHVRDGIRKALAGLGLGHFPRDLPEYQWKPVRVYRLGSPVGDLIEAVLELDVGRDEQLRRAAGGSEAQILQQIRELVCP